MNSDTFQFTYKTVDDLFNFITGNDGTSFLKNAKTKSYSKPFYASKKKSKKSRKSFNSEIKSFSSKTVSNFSDKVRLNLSIPSWTKKEENPIGDVEEIKAALRASSVFNTKKIIPIFTDEWLQSISRLSNSKLK